MPANQNPLFSGRANIEWNTANITAANTAADGTGTVTDVFVAHATYGSYVEKAIVRARGTNVATVMRFFINNGGANTTAANNSLIAEVTCPATTVSQTAALAPIEVPFRFPIDPAFKIFVTIGTAVAAGFSVTMIAGNYEIVA